MRWICFACSNITLFDHFVVIDAAPVQYGAREIENLIELFTSFDVEKKADNTLKKSANQADGTVSWCVHALVCGVGGRREVLFGVGLACILQTKELPHILSINIRPTL